MLFSEATDHYSQVQWDESWCQSVAQNGRRMQISIDDDPGDGLSVLLLGILRARGLPAFVATGRLDGSRHHEDKHPRPSPPPAPWDAADLILPKEGEPCYVDMVEGLSHQRGGIWPKQYVEELRLRGETRQPTTVTDADVSKHMRQAFLDFSSAVPTSSADGRAPPLRVVDNGCGLGMYHWYLWRYLGGRSVHTLVDRGLNQRYAWVRGALQEGQLHDRGEPHTLLQL